MCAIIVAMQLYLGALYSGLSTGLPQTCNCV